MAYSLIANIAALQRSALQISKADTADVKCSIAEAERWMQSPPRAMAIIMPVVFGG